MKILVDAGNPHLVKLFTVCSFFASFVAAAAAVLGNFDWHQLMSALSMCLLWMVFGIAGCFAPRWVLRDPAIEAADGRITFRRPTWPWAEVVILQSDIVCFYGNNDGPDGSTQLLIRLTDGGLAKLADIPHTFNVFEPVYGHDTTLAYPCDHLPMGGPTVARKLNVWSSGDEGDLPTSS